MIHSCVVAFGVFLSHSITILSSSSPGAFLFFGLGAPSEGTAEASSVAFRLRSLAAGGAFAPDGGLSARPGLVARLAGGDAPVGLARGLPARLAIPDFGFGTLGLVARFATMEWPPCPGTGEVARDCGSVLTVTTPFIDGLTPGTVPDGVCVPGRAPGLGSGGRIAGPV